MTTRQSSLHPEQDNKLAKVLQSDIRHHLCGTHFAANNIYFLSSAYLFPDYYINLFWNPNTGSDKFVFPTCKIQPQKDYEMESSLECFWEEY